MLIGLRGNLLTVLEDDAIGEPGTRDDAIGNWELADDVKGAGNGDVLKRRRHHGDVIRVRGHHLGLRARAHLICEISTTNQSASFAVNQGTQLLMYNGMVSGRSFPLSSSFSSRYARIPPNVVVTSTDS